MAKYLDLAGLTTFWGKAKEWMESKLASKANTEHTHKKSEITDFPAIPTALKNPNKLTMGGKTYDGSEAVTLLASDIGAAASAHTHGIATASAAGFVKPASVIAKPTINAATTTGSRYYHVQMSSDGAMFVNVPWTDNNTTYDLSPYMKKSEMTTISEAEITALFSE